jgi:heme-degrading monooxygenase HmoA
MAQHIRKVVSARTDTTVAFTLGSPHVRANPKVRRFFRLRKKAEGFLGQTRTVSEDKLTMTQITTWESPEAAKAFRQAHPKLAKAVKRIMRRFNQKHGLTNRARLIGPNGAELPVRSRRTPNP